MQLIARERHSHTCLMPQFTSPPCCLHLFPLWLCVSAAAVHAELLKQAAFLTTQRVMAADGSLIKETPLSSGRKEFEQQGYR